MNDRFERLVILIALTAMVQLVINAGYAIIIIQAIKNGH